ncbi:hypothetical protein SFC07_08505 [Corynebacterium callunae]|uniref:hypothetical protein n=1 Tax=Corynebacterium callunae TaxID=1721 RepID=UPI0039824304
MLAARMIPALWFRLIVIIAFTAFMVWESMWILALIGVLLTLVTVWQLLTAYKTKAQTEE